jgi:hypothetical protein
MRLAQRDDPVQTFTSDREHEPLRAWPSIPKHRVLRLDEEAAMDRRSPSTRASTLFGAQFQRFDGVGDAARAGQGFDKVLFRPEFRRPAPFVTVGAARAEYGPRDVTTSSGKEQSMIAWYRERRGGEGTGHR